MKTQFIFLTIFLLGIVTSNYVTAQTNTFPSSGNVGIGTLSSSNPLTIRSTEDNQLRIINPNSTTGTKAGISFTTGGGWEVWLNTSKSGNWLELTDKYGTVKQKWIDRNFYAGRFYDISNSSYYLDPASTSNSLIVAGKVGIGCTNPQVKLAVNGTIKASELEITSGPCSDFVFESDYDLMDLNKLEEYLINNKHLPEVPSAQEFSEKGYNVKDMDDILLRKIEELTLYVIELKKENESLKAEIGKVVK